MDKIAKTCGHYDAYRKGAEFDINLELCVPLAKQDNNKNNQCFNIDANELVKTIYADLIYIDPPYNLDSTAALTICLKMLLDGKSPKSSVLQKNG